MGNRAESADKLTIALNNAVVSIPDVMGNRAESIFVSLRGNINKGFNPRCDGE